MPCLAKSERKVKELYAVAISGPSGSPVGSSQTVPAVSVPSRVASCRIFTPELRRKFFVGYRDMLCQCSGDVAYVISYRGGKVCGVSPAADSDEVRITFESGAFMQYMRILSVFPKRILVIRCLRKSLLSLFSRLRMTLPIGFPLGCLLLIWLGLLSTVMFCVRCLRTILGRIPRGCLRRP